MLEVEIGVDTCLGNVHRGVLPRTDDTPGAVFVASPSAVNAVVIVTIEGAPPMLIGSLLTAGVLFGVPIAVWLPVAVLAVVGVVALKMRRRRRR
ncbi:hypothetical protein [Amycolatopsis pigmentata]|uniref:Uncharacterized protein n=1 Tax=Amycolatopsis pigmentata TaxID=450801 RepID=A0ABW5FM50_9PSEU